MQLGVVLRNMGPQSTRETLVAAARAADGLSAIADLWVVDHIAIPPDDAEGSDGRYLDPLATLAYLAGVTTRVGLGTAVLVLPYRPALPTSKWIATVQELSGGRLSLGVGVGWMAAEFRALGVDLRRRGALTDETLAFLERCFAADVVEANGQPFLFRPRPPRPPLFIGGAPRPALRRAPPYGAGRVPIGPHPHAPPPPAAHPRARAAAPRPGAAAVRQAMMALPTAKWVSAASSTSGVSHSTVAQPPSQVSRKSVYSHGPRAAWRRRARSAPARAERLRTPRLAA